MHHFIQYLQNTHSLENRDKLALLSIQRLYFQTDNFESFFQELFFIWRFFFVVEDPTVVRCFNEPKITKALQPDFKRPLHRDEIKKSKGWIKEEGVFAKTLKSSQAAYKHEINREISRESGSGISMKVPRMILDKIVYQMFGNPKQDYSEGEYGERLYYFIKFVEEEAKPGAGPSATTFSLIPLQGNSKPVYEYLTLQVGHRPFKNKTGATSRGYLWDRRALPISELYSSPDSPTMIPVLVEPQATLLKDYEEKLRASFGDDCKGIDNGNLVPVTGDTVAKWLLPEGHKKKEEEKGDGVKTFREVMQESLVEGWKSEFYSRKIEEYFEKKSEKKEEKKESLQEKSIQKESLEKAAQFFKYRINEFLDLFTHKLHIAFKKAEAEFKETEAGFKKAEAAYRGFRFDTESRRTQRKERIGALQALMKECLKEEERLRLEIAGCIKNQNQYKKEDANYIALTRLLLQHEKHLSEARQASKTVSDLLSRAEDLELNYQDLLDNKIIGASEDGEEDVGQESGEYISDGLWNIIEDILTDLHAIEECTEGSAFIKQPWVSEAAKIIYTYLYNDYFLIGLRNLNKLKSWGWLLWTDNQSFGADAGTQSKEGEKPRFKRYLEWHNGFVDTCRSDYIMYLQKLFDFPGITKKEEDELQALFDEHGQAIEDAMIKKSCVIAALYHLLENNSTQLKTLVDKEKKRISEIKSEDLKEEQQRILSKLSVMDSIIKSAPGKEEESWIVKHLRKKTDEEKRNFISEEFGAEGTLSEAIQDFLKANGIYYYKFSLKREEYYFPKTMFFPLSLLYLRLIFIDFSIIVSSLRVASDDKQTFQQNIHHAIDAKFFSINQYVSLAEVLKACDYEDERFAAVIYYLIFGAWAQLALTATWLSIKIALWSCCEILRASFLLLAGMTMLPEMVALSTAKAQLYFLGHDVVQNRFCSTLFVAVVNFIGALCCTFPLTTKVATVLTPSMAVVMAVMILLYPFIRIVRHYYLNSLAETGNRSLWGVSRNQGKYIEKIHTPYESKDDVLMALRVIGYVGIVAALMYGLHAVYDKIPTPIDMINFITEKPRIQDSATGLSVVMMFAIMWAGCTVVSSIVIGCCIVRTSEEAAPAKEKRAPFFNDDCKEDLLLLRSARSADPSVLGANRFVIAEIPGAYCI